MSIYKYRPHPHIQARQKKGPVKIADQHPHGTAFARFNARLGLKITLLIGTMGCAYIFAVVALISLPSAIRTHDVIVIVAWVAQTFFQLVLLPVIIVGQNLQGAAADKRAQQTFDDAETILAECVELQKHLQNQDDLLLAHQERLGALILASEKRRMP